MQAAIAEGEAAGLADGDLEAIRCLGIGMGLLGM